MTSVGVIAWTLAGAVIGAGAQVLARRWMPRPDHRRLLELAGAVATGSLFALLAWRLGAQLPLFAYSWLAMVSVPLATIDWAIRRLPTTLILTGAGGMITLLCVTAGLDHDLAALLRALTGTVVILALYGALYVAIPGQFGGGDLRLGGLLGCALAWLGWTTLATGTLSGWVAAALALLVQRAAGGRSASNASLPLGPFLIIGAFAAVLTAPASASV
ncbi:prepilin peptidase [Amycolatopsis sp.]|uniref:prepilin peptidase n=1 Tax=Amycolatopsis sp. TaxID=37632 RepID=UPI002BF63BBF|nr:prepilin peptidase [Amycolatopsis sp.]HVV12101.1 prepilin peptidase [Amycolatopsis sp.]